MPIGVIVNAAAIVLGGILGSAAGNLLSEEIKEKSTMIFGLCAIGMGIANVVLMQNMPAIVFSVIIGTMAGSALKIGVRINQAARGMQGLISHFHSSPKMDAEQQRAYEEALVTILVVFCASGTGIYGSMISGMNGGHSILIAKSIMDFFTAVIFACTLGPVVSLIAVPQFVIFFLLYLLAGQILPFTTEMMVADFKAVGGMIMLAAGFRMTGMKDFPLADMIPAMVLVMPVSHIWTTYLLPLMK